MTTNSKHHNTTTIIHRRERLFCILYVSALCLSILCNASFFFGKLRHNSSNDEEDFDRNNSLRSRLNDNRYSKEYVSRMMNTNNNMITNRMATTTATSTNPAIYWSWDNNLVDSTASYRKTPLSKEDREKRKSWTGEHPPNKDDLKPVIRPLTDTPIDPNESMSACMLIMDDNHRLTEWLAYHSHVMPLDYLVVGVDPRSRTSPSKTIFADWRQRYSNMTIVEWTEHEILAGRWNRWEAIQDRRRQSNEAELWAHDHRQRQNMFLRNCLVHMKETKKTWVLLVDSDEYLLFNGQQNSMENYDGIRYPSVGTKGALVNFLQQDRVRALPQFWNPCISIPRMLFGAVESKPKNPNKQQQQLLTSSSINVTKFDTLRYRKHMRRSVTHTHATNGWGKTLIDVSRVQWSDFPTPHQAFQTNPYYMTVHDPLPKVCPKPFVKDENTLLRINHYVGSWEAFSYRSDARITEGRGKTNWEDKAKRADEDDDNIRPWINGYLEEYGTKEAQERLKQTGIFG